MKNGFPYIKFHGGADEVTGSRHFLHLGSARVLFDCGLFQGHRTEALEKNRTFPCDPKEVTAVLLSHAHIDHSGGLPLLVKSGFSGPIHCTEPTADLLSIMLLDSAHIQEEDAAFFNKIHRDEGKIIEALYTEDDVNRTLPLVQAHPYNEFFPVSETARARFLNAGHVLGSAMVEVEFKFNNSLRRFLFTGDLGRRESLFMEPPKAPKNIDYLFIDSTYGGRIHPSLREIETIFADIIHKIAREKGRILIPSFALERTQEICFIIEKLRRENRIPPIHVYIDSPMAVDITEVFNKHVNQECLSSSFRQYVSKQDDPFGMGTFRYIRTVDESKALNETPGHKIIIAGSGMCEGGRILHHLRNNLDKENTLVLLVGYQAQGTLGRRLAEGAKKVRIFGLEHRVLGSVSLIENLSSHADQNDLLWFIKKAEPRPRQVFLVHGEAEQREALKEVLRNEGIDRVILPNFSEEYKLE